MGKKIKNVPDAWIVSLNDRGRKSIKNGKVFLKDGEGFEIELHNPLQLSVLADIQLNGISISKKGLIIKPGQRIYLDCFIDDLKKFIFKTYEVENTSENLNSIDKNGLLQVYFYKEDVVELNWYEKFRPYYVPYYVPYYPNNPYYPYKPYNPYEPSPFIYLNGNGSGYSKDNSYTINSNDFHITNSINDYTYINYSSTSNRLCNSNIETGRVEKGDKSNQEFDEIYMSFQKNYISSTIIKILPDSRNPITSNDIKKNKNKNKKLDEIKLIKELYSLYEMGILKEIEYEEAKSRILSKIK